MKIAPQWLLSLLARETEQQDDDRADIAYLQMARKDASFRPLRDVLADIEATEQAKERGKLRSPVRQTG